ncbi:MAG TPA: lysylphosphatidylglycerol synthase domain-containing protein [Stenotrophomonas sp.]
MAFLVFLAVVAYLLVRAARAIDWAQVGQTLAGYSAATVFKACAITVASYLVYGGYELAARRDARHHLPAPRVMSMAAVAYAFSLNLGALLGGAGFRYRLYSRAGMGLATVGRVVAFVLVTSWVGYLTLAGALFVSGQVRPPPDWRLSGEALPWLGAGMLLLVAIYLVACQRMHGRVLHFRGRHFRLPSLPLALLQVVLSATNWALMALLVFVLMPPGVDFPSVLGALLVAAVASAIAHVPAGLGVMEAVFIPLLDHQASQSQLLAALLAYRAFYYLGPLVLAAMGYAVLERRAPAGAVGSGRGE